MRGQRASMSRFFERLDRFDAAVESRYEPLRRNGPLNRVALTASEVGDFGVVWMVLAAIPALGGSGRSGRALIRMGGALAIESLIVNQGLKRVFNRSRPERSDTPDLAPVGAIRHPTTSSFPSGHSTSAATAAVLLSETLPVPAAALWAAAGVVASSRVHVKMHHASDVVGGVCVGLAMGLLFRRVVRV
jgi:undecaprenyl-diphosphatase